MEKIFHHPLRHHEARLVQALQLNGMTLLADHQSHELIESNWGFDICSLPEDIKAAPVLLEDGYQLRTNLLGTQLPKLRDASKIAHFCVGQVFDASDAAYPNRTRIEGMFTIDKLAVKPMARYWEEVAQNAFCMNATVSVDAADKNSYSVEATVRDATFRLAYVTKANSLARTLTGVDDAVELWIYTIDVDSIAVAVLGLSGRDELYSPLLSFIADEHFECCDSSSGSSYIRRASNLLRSQGYMEFSGIKIVEADCYKKMNMIQDSWDTNNQGCMLVEPLGDGVWLPTVLTPALEEALAANWRAGVTDCKLFEIGHIFKPDPKGGDPSEKLSLSIGAYGYDLDGRKWKTFVDQLLSDFGISNHFFIPTDMAIAYDAKACWIILDEHMSYLDGNFGGISPKACENHGIGVPAFMAQFEFDTIERKAAEELDFVPQDYQ